MNVWNLFFRGSLKIQANTGQRERFLNLCRNYGIPFKNVYFIKGSDLLDDAIAESALIENCHPNDCGFASMARVMGSKLKEVIKI